MFVQNQTFSMKSETYNNCPCCGQSLQGRWEGISKRLVHTLANFREAVIKKGENRVHLQKDVALTKSEYNNFQKLRYHSLVIQLNETGYWALTEKGNEFLKGKIAIPKAVLIAQNKIRAVKDEKVFVYDVLNGESIWFTKHTFKYELAQMSEYVLEEDRNILWNQTTGQGMWNFNCL